MTASPRIGSVPYLNARPLVEGLAERPDVIYSESIPSRLAGELEAGDVDVALVSSVEQLRLRGARRIGNYGIVSNGPVWSVLLVGPNDPLAARTVALDGASFTAATLTRITYGTLLERHDVTFQRTRAAPDLEAETADATLIIGDAALGKIPAGMKTVDLGKIWTDHTGLPFVWATWLARPELSDEPTTGILDAAASAGLQRREQHAAGAARYGVDPSRALGYLQEAIRFPLGPAEEEGLARFLEWARPHVQHLGT